MLRRLGAAVSVLTLLLGFVAAPHTHVHQSAPGLGHAHADDYQPSTLRHAHVTPHSGDPDSHHPPVEGEQDAEQKIWSVGGFVFQAASVASAAPPALPVSVIAQLVPPGSWVRVIVTHPGAHGPPSIAGFPLRGPPFAPAAVS